MSRQIEVRIIGDASSLKRAFGQAESAAGTLGGKLGGLAKGGLKLLGTAALAAGAAAGAGLAATLKVGISSLIEHEKADAQTAAALKSTGNAAKVTAQQIRDHASALEKLTGVDDVAIQGAQNLLLTFTNIRNEVGRGNDIFTQATEAALDMSVALGTDMSSASIQLGKALNDPIKGVTALQRVGVSFTEAQREQIKAMVESGDVMGAQKLILAELTKEFGGSAEALGETFAGRLDILKAKFEELAEGIAEKVMPYAEKFVGFLSDVIDSDSASEALGKIGGAIGDAFKGIKGWIEDVDWKGVASTIGEKMRSAWGAVEGWFSGVDWVGAMRTVAGYIGDALAAVPWGDVLRKAGDVGATLVEGLVAILRDIDWGEVASVAWDLLSGALEGGWKIAEAIGQPFYEFGVMIGEEMGKGIAKASAFILDSIAGLISAIGDAFDFMSGMPLIGDTFKGWSEGIDGAAKSLNDLADEFRNAKTPAEKLEAQILSNLEATSRANDIQDKYNDVLARTPAGLRQIAADMVGTSTKVTEMQTAVMLLAAELGRMPTEAEVEAHLEGDGEFKRKVHDLTAEINGMPFNPTVKAKMLADEAIGRANAMERAVKDIPESRRTSVSTPGAVASASALHGVRDAAYSIPTSRSVTITTIYQTIRNAFADGGVSPGGMALVGEEGPELVALPRGARVYSNSESRRIAGRGGVAAGAGGLTVNVHVAGSVMTERDLVRAVYDGIHAHVGAGNPSLWGARA